MTKVYLVIRKDCYEFSSEIKTILGVFSTPEKATDMANEYIIKEWKENCDKYSHRCPKTPLTYDDIHCNYWAFKSDIDDYSAIKIVDYELDSLNVGQEGV